MAWLEIESYYICMWFTICYLQTRAFNKPTLECWVTGFHVIDPFKHYPLHLHIIRVVNWMTNSAMLNYKISIYRSLSGKLNDFIYWQTGLYRTQALSCWLLILSCQGNIELMSDRIREYHLSVSIPYWIKRAESTQKCHLSSIGVPIVQMRWSWECFFLYDIYSYSGKTIILHCIVVTLYTLEENVSLRNHTHLILT